MSLAKLATPAVLLALAALAAPASAQPVVSNRVFDAATVYAGQGVDLNLRQVPGAIFGGDKNWESSYFASLALSKELGTLGETSAWLQTSPFGALRYGYEVNLTRHHGLQDHLEAGATGKLSTPAFFLGPVGVGAAVGAGLSHAFGTPVYEDGPRDNPSRRYRTQLLFTFDLEWRLRAVENLSVVTRVHHRSGGYGVVAPRHVGSNFFALGVRYRF
jgi:hypothetical protein